jgi:hypothetical protein
MKTKIETDAVIPGFRAVESACTWKVKVAHEIQGFSVKETLKYFRVAATSRKSQRRKTSIAKP